MSTDPDWRAQTRLIARTANASSQPKAPTRAGAIDSRTLSVPDAEYPVVARSFDQVRLLTKTQSGDLPLGGIDK